MHWFNHDLGAKMEKKKKAQGGRNNKKKDYVGFPISEVEMSRVSLL